jgi:hypothetical protein
MNYLSYQLQEKLKAHRSGILDRMPHEAREVYAAANTARGEGSSGPTTNTVKAADLQSAIQAAMTSIERDRKQKIETDEFAATPAGRDLLAMAPKAQAAEIRRRSGLNQGLGGKTVSQAMECVVKNLGIGRYVGKKAESCRT